MVRARARPRIAIPAEFVATVRDVAPSIEVDTVEPGRRLVL